MPWKVALVGTDVVYGAARSEGAALRFVQRLNSGSLGDDS